MYEFITIERSYASGGHQVATELAKKLNYRLYDHEVLVETCRRLDMPYIMIADMDENIPAKNPFAVRGDKYLPLEEQIFNTEKEIILDAVKEPGCIFVGRCACEILKDYKCLKVYITADKDFRMNRAIEVEKIEPNNVEKMMQKFDTRREKYFSAHANTKWGAPEYFDMILNSGELGIDACVDILSAACQSLI